jgi:hypothetical protein
MICVPAGDRVSGLYCMRSVNTCMHGIPRMMHVDVGLMLMISLNDELYIMHKAKRMVSYLDVFQVAVHPLAMS